MNFRDIRTSMDRLYFHLNTGEMKTASLSEYNQISHTEEKRKARSICKAISSFMFFTHPFIADTFCLPRKSWQFTNKKSLKIATICFTLSVGASQGMLKKQFRECKVKNKNVDVL